MDTSSESVPTLADRSDRSGSSARKAVAFALVVRVAGLLANGGREGRAKAERFGLSLGGGISAQPTAADAAAAATEARLLDSFRCGGEVQETRLQSSG